MKKFTINCDFGGQMSPFAIYIGKPEQNHHPLHFQADWLSKTRGGMIPSEVMEAVTKLQELANKNNVSLEELCVYALGAEEQQAELESEDDEDDNISTDEDSDENIEGDLEEDEEIESEDSDENIEDDLEEDEEMESEDSDENIEGEAEIDIEKEQEDNNENPVSSIVDDTPKELPEKQSEELPSDKPK